MRCPVCQLEHRGTNKCFLCGFNQLQCEFLNQEEADHWFNNVLIPYKQCWEAYCLVTRWIDYILENPNSESGIEAAKRFSYEIEIMDLVCITTHSKLRDYLFADVKDWCDLCSFARIINRVTDYKLLVYILLYKMRTEKDILRNDSREFFIIICERIIVLIQFILDKDCFRVQV